MFAVNIYNFIFGWHTFARPQTLSSQRLPHPLAFRCSPASFRLVARMCGTHLYFIWLWWVVNGFHIPVDFYHFRYYFHRMLTEHLFLHALSISPATIWRHFCAWEPLLKKSKSEVIQAKIQHLCNNLEDCLCLHVPHVDVCAELYAFQVIFFSRNLTVSHLSPLVHQSIVIAYKSRLPRYTKGSPNELNMQSNLSSK